MSLSNARRSSEESSAAMRSLDAAWVFSAARRTAAIVLATIVVFATIGFVLNTQQARADTTFATGQVFVSVGFGEVDVYDPASGNQLSALVDSTNSQYTAGTAFDANGDLFVADGSTGNISEFSPTGAPMGVFASGLSNPAALVFDQAGNLYVGQVRSNYIAEFSPTGQRMSDIGPLKTQLYGDDWIDLSSDQCTFYYTSERNAVMAYNDGRCANGAVTPQQLPDFTQQPLAGPAAYELRIIPNGGAYAGDVLVADSDRVVLLDNQGNVSQTYLCSSLPGCAGQLYGLALDPNGTSFWVSDPFSGLVWQVDIATGNVVQMIDSQAAYLYGLSVAGEVTAASTVASSVPQTKTTTTIQPLTTPLQYGTPTPVSAVVTSTTNDVTSIVVGQPVVFTLSGGNETCTGITDSTGTATCSITPTEPAQSYTLSATFNGVQDQTNPIGGSNEIVPETVGSEQPTISYTGPTTGVNGQPITLTGTLTTPAGDTPLPASQPVTFTVGSGTTAQTCPSTVDSNGNILPCTLTLDQPVSNVTITTSYAGLPPYIASSTSTTNVTVTEPTTLTVHSTGGDYGDVTTVSATLTDASNNPLAGQSVTLTMNGNSTESCGATTDANGLASCNITPLEPNGQGNYPLTASFNGRPDLPLQLTGSTASGTFNQQLEETQLTYTGGTVAKNGQPLAVSGVLTSEGPTDTDGDASTSAPIAGRAVTFVLGSGAGAQTCQALTDSTGTANCSITPLNQPAGPIPVSDTFAGDNYYKTASASSTVNLPEGTQLVISNPTTNTYNGQSTLTGTLTNTYSGQPVNGEPVTLTINGTQSCTAITGANGNPSGVASCTVSPNEPAGTYSFTGSFPGDTTSMPQLLSSGSTSTIVVTPAPTTLTYGGTASVTNGQPATFSGTVTSSNPTSGTDVSGVPVTFTIGSGGSLQSCSGTSNASGYVSCTIPKVNQTTATVTVTGNFPGNDYYGSSTVSSSATVHTPTTLTVSDSSPATVIYGAPTTLTGTLTTYAGVPVPNQSVTLTLNGTQSCVATTNASGVASCTVTVNEPAGSYTLSGTFPGMNSSGYLSPPTLNPSSGTNTVTVIKAPTTSTYTAPSIVVNGLSATLSGTVSTSLGSGLTGQTATLTVGSGGEANSCTGTITASGSVSCTIPTLKVCSSGTLPVTVSYGGSAYYGSSSSSFTVIVAAAPSAGAFVVGNLSAGTPPSTMPSGIVSGNTVNFWGSQYWKNNSFSGVLNAPASMKGYIDNGASDEAIPVLQPSACGKQWVTDPGNSSHPPATIPTYMLVIVSSTENKLGSQEYGDVKHILVVQVSPGYGPAPGHDGWGKIVGWLC